MTVSTRLAVKHKPATGDLALSREEIEGAIHKLDEQMRELKARKLVMHELLDIKLTTPKEQ